MILIKNVSIPQACHQSWQQMTEVAEGRHCESCCKTVTDFTRMNNEEIIKYLSAKDNICGRFEKEQLNNFNNKLHIHNLSASGWWKQIVVVLGMIGPISLKVSGQTNTPVVKTVDTTQKNNESHNFVLGKVAAPDITKYRIITGCISDNANEVIPGATVASLSNDFGTMTDNQGNFKLRIPDSTRQLKVSFIGYQTQLIDIDDKSGNNYCVDLKLQEMFLGEMVVVVRTSLPKRIYYKFIKRPLQKIFH